MLTNWEKGMECKSSVQLLNYSVTTTVVSIVLRVVDPSICSKTEARGEMTEDFARGNCQSAGSCWRNEAVPLGDV